MKCSLLLLCMLISAPSYASFLGTSVNFTFSDTISTENTNGVPVVDPGLELSGLDAGGIGNAVMYDDEYIDIRDSSIVFGLVGGGPKYKNSDGSDNPNYETTGLDSTATYRIDFLTADTLALFKPLMSADVVLTDIIGVTLGTELLVNVGLDFISLNVGTLGINAIADFGTVALNFTAKPPSAVPIPAALPLMLSGLALIGFLSRRRRAC